MLLSDIRAKFSGIFFVILSCIVLMTACSPLDGIISFFADDGSGYIFKISIDSDPRNLDPQIASDNSSVMIAKNMFVGLLRCDGSGRIIPGVAKDYSISSDGLVYTFYLDERYSWNSAADFSAPVTADDFVFAFERIFDIETASPYASDYLCISGANELYNTGEGSLGVIAVDEYTLEIRLEYQNAELLSLLTELPASPCNREFFESCKGKYGLETDSIASNGPFYAAYWLHDEYGSNNYLRLRRNSGYSEISRVYPAGINYLVVKDDAEKLYDFTEGTTDLYISYAPEGSLVGFPFIESYNRSVGIIPNPENELLSEKDIREIFSLCINRDYLSDAAYGHFISAYGIVSPAAHVGGTLYRDSVVLDEPEYNSRLAEYKWEISVSEDDKSLAESMTLLVPESFADRESLEDLTAMWEDALNVGIAIEVVNDYDYSDRASSGDFDFLLAVIDPKGCDAEDYLSGFACEEFGIAGNRCAELLQKSGKYSSLTAALGDIREAELGLIEDYFYIPLWYCPEIVYYADDNEGFEYDSISGAVIFEKAKHF